MTLTDQVVKNIIKRLIKGQDYRIEVVALINAEFLQFAIDFFKKVVTAKLDNQDITIDWYKQVFLNPALNSDEIAIHSGLNKKTIMNMYNSATKEIVIDAANEHYDVLHQLINDLVENQSEIDLRLTVKFKTVSVELNINESLIIINTLAVKRAALRGGLWSTTGKQVEKYLMITLCQIFNVPHQYVDQSLCPDSMREVDFFLSDQKNNYYRCEVKLMGKGNPESADAIFARKSDIFIADKLSELNKQQADDLNVNWVELRTENGYQRFATVLQKLQIPFSHFNGNLDECLNQVIEKIFNSH
jgi:hypothetical protein